MSVVATVNDVLFGQGGKSNHHPGNKAYRDLILAKKEEYGNQETKRGKGEIADAIIACVHARGGRFLNKHGHVEDDHGKIRAKVLQALRGPNNAEARDKRVFYEAKKNQNDLTKEQKEACARHAQRMKVHAPMPVKLPPKSTPQVVPSKRKGSKKSGDKRLYDETEGLRNHRKWSDKQLQGRERYIQRKAIRAKKIVFKFNITDEDSLESLRFADEARFYETEQLPRDEWVKKQLYGRERYLQRMAIREGRIVTKKTSPLSTDITALLAPEDMWLKELIDINSVHYNFLRVQEHERGGQNAEENGASAAAHRKEKQEEDDDDATTDNLGRVHVPLL